MEWSDDGIVLSARKHGESSAVVVLLTAAHGRHAGLVRGGAGRAQRGVFQPGNLVRAHWRARLEEHLGSYRCEPVRAVAAGVLDDPKGLAALSSACAVLEAALPEREAHARAYADTLALLDAMGTSELGAAYVRWELALLADLGFGLDLTRCASTGAADNLVYVSPRSGRAVSAEAGAPYKDRLLPLPPFLIAAAPAGPAEIAAGLVLAGHFLAAHVLAPHGRVMPAARLRLTDWLGRIASGVS